MAQPHPLIYRVQNQLHVSPVKADPFKKILAPDDNIYQAESILSSLVEEIGDNKDMASGLVVSRILLLHRDLFLC